MKKIICIILAIISVVCLGTLTACKNTNKPKTSSYSEQKTNSQSEQKTISQSEKKDCSHEYEETVINATCLTDGKTTYTCKKCGNTYDVVIPALQHHNVIVKTDEATCDKSKVNYYECDRDGCDYAYTETVGEPLGHLSDGIKQETTPVSCDADGYTTYHCSRCNQDYIADVVKTEGHKIEKQSTITATCDSVGYDLMKCANCDYTEKVNFVANPQHDFEDGICKNCGKSVKTALPFSSNVSNGIYAVHKDSMYEVYAPAYSENTIVIPYYMLVALQQNEIYSFSLSMGANNGKYGLSLQCVINGENTYGLNCSSNEIKSVTTYTFADSDGVFDILEDTGIELAVYYRVLDYINEEDGSGLVDHYCIKLSYLEKFDIENPLTWTDKSEGVTYSYDEKYKEHYLTFTGYESGSKIKLRKEFLAYLFNNEYTQFTVQVGSKMSAGQRLSIDASTTAGDRLFGNLGTGIGSYSVATYYQNDFEITVSYTDLYGVQGWDATSAADGFNIYITTIPCLIKEPELPEFDLDNPLTWTDKSEGVTYLFDTKWQEHNLIFTGYESGSTIKLRKELLTALKESGSTKFTVQIGCKASAGQRISVGAVTTGGNIAAANLGTSVLTFNVADYYQNDFEITVSYTDLYGVQGWDATSAADGFVIYLKTILPELPEFNIVISSNASETEENIANLLIKYLEEATGKKPELLSDDTAKKLYDKVQCISVGNTETLDTAGLKKYAENNVGEDGYILKYVGKSLFIDGITDRGTLYGMYDLLEQYFGYTFVDNNTVVSETVESYDLSTINVEFTPTFAGREYAENQSFGNWTVSNTVIYRNNNGFWVRNASIVGAKLADSNVIAGCGNKQQHSMGEALKAGVEIYNTINSTNIDYNDYAVSVLGGSAHQPCVSSGVYKDTGSNLNAVYFTYLGMKQLILTNYSNGVRYFDLSQSDGDDTYCTCSTCNTKATELGRSGQMIAFVNAVIALLNADEDIITNASDYKIVTLAYSYTFEKPIVSSSELKYADNVCVTLTLGCNDHKKGLNDSVNSEQYQNVSNWAPYANDMIIQLYDADFYSYVDYYPSINSSILDNVYTLKQLGVTDVMVLGKYNGANYWDAKIAAYIYSKAMYNFDTAKYTANKESYFTELLQEYLKAFYGSNWESVYNIISYYQTAYETESFNLGTNSHKNGTDVARTPYYSSNLTIAQHQYVIDSIDTLLSSVTDKMMKQKLLAIKVSAMAGILNCMTYANTTTGLADYINLFYFTCLDAGITQWNEIRTVKDYCDYLGNYFELTISYEDPNLPKFDIDDPSTWTDKSEGFSYTYVEKDKEHYLIYTGYESGSTIKLRKGFLTYLYNNGYTQFTVQIGSKMSAGQRLSIDASTTAGDRLTGNLGTGVGSYNVADYYQNDFEITVSYTDLYPNWPDSTSAADGFNIYITTTPELSTEPALPEFDLDDPLTWTDKTKDVTYLFDTKWQEHNLIFTGYESGTTIKLRKELLTALKELGSTKFTVQIGSKASAGQHISINASTTAEDTLFGNGGTNVGTYSLATYYQNDFEITVIFTDNYGTAWNPTNEADGFVIYITYDEPALPEFDLDDPLTWTDKTKDVTYLFDTKWQEHNLIFTGYESGTKIKLRKELLKALKELGSTKFTVQIGCKASDGQRISVGAVTTGGNIATANLGTSVLTLNLADYYQADFEITVTYTDLYPNWPDGTSAADGFVIYFTYDEPALPEFDIDDPLTWIDKSEGVSYLFDTKWQEHNLIFTGYESGTTIKLRKELLAYLNTNGYTQFTVQIGCKASAGQRISVGAVTTGGNIAAANLGTATITYNVADYYQADFEITVTYTDLYPNWPDGTSAADGFVIYFTYSKSN